MALKKSELYSSLWESCNELRGGMDASQYKDYVLVLLFVKYISDKFSGKPYAPITIPLGASFTDMVALKGKTDIGDQINKKILAPLAEANNLSDMPDFNDPVKLGDGKEKVERLTNLIAIFENPALDFSQNRADGDDLLGDAYEYLMQHFATESGKSKGQFYTPAEVSRIMAQILDIKKAKTTNDTTVYDPTCGSGSLLLKIGDEGSRARDVKLTLYGQEKDNVTAGLARMNMILHDYATAEVKQGNTLANPLFKDGEALKTFDYVVANPPFSDKRWSTGLTPNNDQYGRFDGYGVPPAKQGDYAYLLHILRSLKSTGKGACILPHGVLFRGNVEGVIRKNLIKRGYIKGVIGLPPNLFFGTGIPACIIVLDKEVAQANRGIFMIDASRGFRKDGPKNRLREQDIHRIVDTFTRQIDVPGYSRMVSISEISDEKNDFNLNLPRYIDSSETDDIQDIEGHLRGGIPESDISALNNFWTVFPGIRKVLFESNGHSHYVKLKMPIESVRPAIFEHPEFSIFNQNAVKIFSDWQRDSEFLLTKFSKCSKPKPLIENLSENLLSKFHSTPLINAYDIFQHLMDYWAQTMRDDCYLIADLGWYAGAQPREIYQIKGKDGKLSWPEGFDFKKGKRRFKSDLIPAAILIAHYFKGELSNIEILEAKLKKVEQEIQDLIDEDGGEDGILSEVIEGEIDKQKITLKVVKARIKEIKGDVNYADELIALNSCLELLEKQVTLKAQIKTASEDLDEKLDGKYPNLKEEEIKSLVINEKWFESISSVVKGELNRVSGTLAGRIHQLAQRYESPLPLISQELSVLSTRVDDHLKKMGITWS